MSKSLFAVVKYLPGTRKMNQILILKLFEGLFCISVSNISSTLYLADVSTTRNMANIGQFIKSEYF